MAEKTIKILNVNDDGATRYLITRMLQRGGFEVLEASSGQEGLEKLAGGPSLVVLDVKLPDVSGFEVCRRIKDDPRTASLPVLMVSANFVRSENKVQGLEGGADGYLVQPLEQEELIATVRALLRMREAEAEASRLSRDWQSTFDAISDPVCMLDVHGRMARANAACRDLLLQGESSFAGRSFGAVMRALGGESPSELDSPATSGVFEVRLGERWFRVSADPVTDAQGNVTSGVRVLADLTDRRRLEEELRARADQLALADKRKDEFLAMLAHELRNPLAAIVTGLQLLDRLKPLEGRPARMRDLVRRQAKHLSRLVDDLLDVSRITRGKIQLQPQRVDLVGVVRQAIQVVRPLAEERKHTVEAALPEQPVWIHADPTRMEQVIANLLDNAAKYTEPGGKVFVSVAPGAEGWAEVKVRDTGIGISAEMLGRVFEPFTQGEQSLARSRGGLGIGLTLVHQLTQMHGGTVTVASPGVGKGSEFTIRLPTLSPDPVVVASALGAAVHLAPPPGSSGQGPRGRRVLLVEDNVDAREALQDLLHDWGHQVETAHDGPSAVERAVTLRPEVALVDIGLPGMDGYQVARQVRARPEGKGLFLVALTGYGGTQQRRQALEAGFDLHLVKPVDPDELARVLADLPAVGGSARSQADAGG